MGNVLTSGLKQVLNEKLANSLQEPIPSGIPRQVFGRIEFPGKATAVIGMRRAGKTTFLHQLRHARIASGRDRTSLPYINFEDERLADLTAGGLTYLVEEYSRRFPDAYSRGPVTWCFDEVQVLSGWEGFVRRLLDDPKENEVIVTGSSAALLSRELATALRGRAWEVLIYPFSFRETLQFKGKAVPEDPAFISEQERRNLEVEVADWLKSGGFPEAQNLDTSSRHQLLQDYVDVAMLRDVMERHDVRNLTGLRWLLRHLLGNPAGSFSVEKFYSGLKSQGIAISKDTVHQLLGYLEDCFLLRTVWMESDSERQRMVNPRKAYPIDTGLIPIFDRTGRANIGHALETAVLIELERRRFQVTWVRTPNGYEVDFLARSAGGTDELIQVCSDAADPETAHREIRGLIDAATRHPQANRRLLTLTRDGIPDNLPDNVIAQPIYEWLLAIP